MPDRGGCEGLRHSVRDGCIQGRSRSYPEPVEFLLVLFFILELSLYIFLNIFKFFIEFTGIEKEDIISTFDQFLGTLSLSKNLSLA